MSTKGVSAPAEVNRDTLEEEELSTHQEAVPVPYLAGTRMVAVRWLSGAMDQVARQAKDDRPGKKG